MNKKIVFLLVVSLFVVCSAMSAWADSANSNPGWQATGHEEISGFPLTWGENPGANGCRLEVKANFSKGVPFVEIVATNCGYEIRNSGRMARAVDYANMLNGRLCAGQVPPCGNKFCERQQF